MVKSFADKIKSELEDHEVSAEVRTQIDAWLSADRDFNTWFLVTTKRALGDDELLALLEGYRESQEIVEEAWERFQDQEDATMLLEGITQSIHRMRTLQDR